jgi:hypothetical protein
VVGPTTYFAQLASLADDAQTPGSTTVSTPTVDRRPAFSQRASSHVAVVRIWWRPVALASSGGEASDFGKRPRRDMAQMCRCSPRQRPDGMRNGQGFSRASGLQRCKAPGLQGARTCSRPAHV